MTCACLRKLCSYSSRVSDEPLEQLARLRTHAVDQARSALRSAEDARNACRRARDAALASEAAHDKALAHARACFVGASSVAALRWSARRTDTELAQRSRCRLVLAERERRLQEAVAQVEALTRLLRARELERRAVTRTLEQRAQAVTRRTEMRLEDEADDAFRARAHRS